MAKLMFTKLNTKFRCIKVKVIIEFSQLKNHEHFSTMTVPMYRINLFT